MSRVEKLAIACRLPLSWEAHADKILLTAQTASYENNTERTKVLHAFHDIEKLFNKAIWLDQKRAYITNPGLLNLQAIDLFRYGYTSRLSGLLSKVMAIKPQPSIQPQWDVYAKARKYGWKVDLTLCPKCKSAQGVVLIAPRTTPQVEGLCLDCQRYVFVEVEL